MLLNIIKMNILDLGCWKGKINGAFGVDFVKFDGVDFVWDLNKELPKKFHNKFDVVHNKCVIDHLGNPMIFLQGCIKYLKKNGKLILIVDNGDYWRYHVKKGTYHATLWEKDDPDHKETQHKMLFQMKHLTNLLELVGFKITNSYYYNDYDNLPLAKKLFRAHIDLFLPNYIGKNMMKIEAIKP